MCGAVEKYFPPSILLSNLNVSDHQTGLCIGQRRIDLLSMPAWICNGLGGWCLSLTYIDGLQLPVHHRTTYRETGKTAMHTHSALMAFYSNKLTY